MAYIHPKAYFKDKIIPIEQANLSVASSAVLYGLSVYTVFPILVTEKGLAAFRLQDHFARLVNSAKIIGIDTFEKEWNYEKFEQAVQEIVAANTIEKTSFVRATVHVSDLVPGTRSRGLGITLSMFVYEANPIIPQHGARLKTSVWRRVPDYAIPSRAKVNGAYVNSVLGKQDALDSGYDDCIFLDTDGHVCELSAANIFMVRDGVLITPQVSNDILEGINRKTMIEIAQELGIEVVERNIDLTELYMADEVFACGTSAFVAPIIEIDARKIKVGEVTGKLKKRYEEIMEGKSGEYMTLIK
ncbi:MAG: aminotransferase class IV [Patescibacteria group bacterium]